MTIRSKYPQNAEKPQIDRADLAKLLLQVLPGKPGKPSTEAFKRTLREEFGGSGSADGQGSEHQLRRVAQDLLRQLEQAKGMTPPNSATRRRPTAQGQSKPAKRMIAQATAATAPGQKDEPKELAIGFEHEHPAIIAQRLRRLPSKSQETELNRFSGELARQVRFLIWQLK